MPGQAAKPLRPELVPLVEILARAAYEAILRGEFSESRSVPDQPTELKEIPNERPAA